MSGGRKSSGDQPKSVSAAGPHTHPWHGPIPILVMSLASRHDRWQRSRPAATSSQRQTTVSSVASRARRRSRANVRSSAAANRRHRPAAGRSRLASSRSPAAASPAIRPSTSDLSRPPTPVHSPGTVVAPTSSIAIAARYGYFQSLEHLLRYCARPPFALERLSVIRGPDGPITQVRYVLPRHKAANWVGPGRGRKSTRPGANGVVDFPP